MKRQLLVVIILFNFLPFLNAQEVTNDSWAFSKIEYDHVLKTSLFGLIDLTSHCIEIGFEKKLKGVKYLDISLGYSPNLQQGSFLERDYFGIRSQIMYKSYFEPALFSKRSGSYYGFAIRNTYLWDERFDYFSRLNGIYIQEYDYTESKFKTGLLVALGNVRKVRHTIVEFGGMAGFTHFYTKFKGIDEDAERLETNFLSFGAKEGHAVLPSVKLILKIGFMVN